MRFHTLLASILIALPAIAQAADENALIAFVEGREAQTTEIATALWEFAEVG